LLLEQIATARRPSCGPSVICEIGVISALPATARDERRSAVVRCGSGTRLALRTNIFLWTTAREGRPSDFVNCMITEPTHLCCDIVK
jgi:hypothetical protein